MECISAINKSLEGEVSTTIVAGNIKERFIRRIKILNNKYGTDNFVPPKLFRDGKLYNDFTMYDGLHQLSLMDDTEFIGVSSTLVFTLANNSKKVFNTRLIKKDGHSIKNLYLDDKAMHNLALTSSTPLDLPMVCEPRSPGFEHNKFIYGPYVTDDANQYCDPFHSILRSKHDLMKMPEGQEILSDCVNYLNRQKLVIHEEVLDFLISE